MSLVAGSCALVLCLCANSLSAQNQFILSTLEQVPQRSFVNPALTPDVKYYVGIPVTSGLHVSFYNQGFTLMDVGYSGYFGGQIDYDIARRQTSEVNLFRADARVDLLNIGVSHQSSFFSFNFTERLVGEARLPNNLFRRLADEEAGGMVAGRWYDLSDLNTTGLHFRELGLGYSNRNPNGLILGFRLKFLLGQEAIFTENTGLMVMENGDGNLESEGMLEARSAGFHHLSDEESLLQLFSSRNTGVALDAGVYYQYDPHWSFFASINDLGGITWRNSLNLQNIDGTFGALKAKIDDTYDALVERPAETTRTFRTSLPTIITAGGSYQFNNKHTLTALAMPRFYKYGKDIGVAVAYQLPIGNCLNVSGSYAYFNKSYTNAGVGFSLQLGPVQWYVAADNVLGAVSADAHENLQLQTGINLVWHKPNDEEARKKKEELPVATLPTPPVERPIDKPAMEKGDYFTLSSTFRSGESGRTVEAIYVDIYRYENDGEKRLIHTSRYPGDKFEVTLYQVSNLHEMTVRAYGFEPVVFQFIPESETLHRDFKLNNSDLRHGK